MIEVENTQVALPLTGAEAEALRAMVEQRCSSPGAAPGDFSLLSRLESCVLQANAKQQWELISARLASAVALLDDVVPHGDGFAFLGRYYPSPDPALLAAWFEKRRLAIQHGHHLRTRLIALERELARASVAGDQAVAPFLARAEKELARAHAYFDSRGVAPGDLVQRIVALFTVGPDPDALGRVVREAWVEWTKTQSDPKPSHLVPYDELSEEDREADRRIGLAVFRYLAGSP